MTSSQTKYFWAVTTEFLNCKLKPLNFDASLKNRGVHYNICPYYLLFLDASGPPNYHKHFFTAVHLTLVPNLPPYFSNLRYSPHFNLNWSQISRLITFGLVKSQGI